MPPSPWLKTAASGDGIAYKRTVDNSVEHFEVCLCAEQAKAEYPLGSGTSSWRISFEKRIHELCSSYTVGCVHSREQLLRTLFQAMRTVNRIVDPENDKAREGQNIKEALDELTDNGRRF
ncbi:hypothetical protein ACFQJC_06750 [Haloferax namakaokahaiae]|uniref:Uncharacterized protein n=1 Tax=Haloferax namakaokahaiae TaxID=1748331 RepID=A0ABD5ZDF1_9EURY